MSEKILFSRKLKIVVTYDNQKLMEKKFHEGPIIFGRMPTCDVHLDYPFISRAHCQVVEEKGRIYLKDLGSRNGLNIDGVTQAQFEVQGKLDFRLDKLLVEIFVDTQVIKSEKPQPSAKAELVENRQNAETVIQSRPATSRSQTGGRSQAGGRSKATNLSKATSLSQPKNRSQAASLSSPAKRPQRTPVVDRSFTADLVGYHAGVRSASQKRLEAVVYWQDQVFEVREFEPRDQITIGPSSLANLQIPTIPRGWALARVDFDKAQCYVPRDKNFSIVRDGKSISSQELIQSKQVSRQGQGFSFKMGQHDVVNVDLGSGMKVFLRYVPATLSLTRKKMSEPDFAIKQAMLGSAIIHGILSLLLIIMAPISKNVPKLKNVPERYARLLVEPPRPIIPVLEPPPLPPPQPLPSPLTPPVVPKLEVVQQEPPKPKPKPKPKPVVKKEKVKPRKIVQPKILENQNKFPMTVKHPVPATVPVSAPAAKVPVPAPVKVEKLGALAALDAVGTDSTPSPTMNNIKIDKNAGGLASKVANTQGMISALPSTTGQLKPLGNGTVKTGGQGIGSGTAYGTQGLSGGAGGRGVAGAVVGTPKLVTSSSSSKIEGLTREQVMIEVQKHLAEVQRCYERSLLSNPSLAGRMEFEWDIEATGLVSDVRIKRSTVNGGDSLGSCVKGLFSAMKFPKAKNRQSTTPNIGFPFGRL